ncbi:CTP synthase [Ascoidea rubescens DSM 1968]|uniref:CTP synthase n=1 Tax=Ascoidea rubescens DSM 1968 TaxID=1344418 RepID=A0A1D2VGD8_9ASCO|nr:CTP synthase [Ascoidea rubescens DSM 1968]ODV60706.1 CTP synthase [Ascoidea rubescens DSM 1968]
MKFVVISGGVISGIGKGVIASSTGLLLKTLGLNVTAIKIDPYMNIDAGTMSPLEHGEVFVMNDGGESDLDLGNYERYLNVNLTKDHNITTGKVYSSVISKERKGDYLGKTVQVVPHLTNEIQERLLSVSQIPVDSSGQTPDICIVELGGTIGDIESAPFVEALRQFQFRVGHENFVLIHVSLIPVINDEQKTKPTQAAIRDLRSLGLTPDMIACRCSKPLQKPTIEKISMFCHVGPNQVLAVHDVNSTYHVPLLLKEQKLLDFLNKRLNLNADIKISTESLKKGQSLLKNWELLCRNVDNSFEVVKIAIVGKYTHLKDSYLSVIKSLEHASIKLKKKLVIIWVEATDLEHQISIDNKASYHKAWHSVCTADGILVPGGFGNRGIEGMIQAAKWARENDIPYLGICLGLQIATIEFARNVLGIQDANSEEFFPNITDDKKIILYMPEINKEKLGGTMRLGLRITKFQKDTDWSVIKKLYGSNEQISERHRHRYEVNPKFVEQIESKGLVYVGKDEKNERMEIFELKDHPYYIGTQYHPEYVSKVLEPSKPFIGLVAASSGVLNEVLSNKQLLKYNGGEADF